MQHCTRCGAVSPDDALSCQRCGHPFDRGKQQKKQRSFLAGLLLLLGIRRNPQTGSLGCALVPTVSVALVAVIIIGVIVGPVLKLIPPFAPGLTVIGSVVPGGSVTVHGTNFPSGSRINLTLDGVSISLAPNSRHSMSQSLYDISLSSVQVSPLQQTEQHSSSAGIITVRNDGTFDAQVSIPKSWQPNSQHIIQAQAIGQDGGVQTQVQQIVTIPNQIVALTSGPSNTTLTASSGPIGTPTGSPSTTACSSSSAGTGTGLTFSFSGAAPSPMCVVRNDGCYIVASSSDYHFSVLGTVNGKLYTFIFDIQYSGPSTYSVYGDLALIVGDFSKLPGSLSEWTNGTTGTWTVTVNGGETSGSVDALMNTNDNTSGTVHVTGNWTCSTLQRR